MEAFTNPIGLWRHGLGFGMVDVVDRQIKLIVMLFEFATLFGAPIGQNP